MSDERGFRIGDLAAARREPEAAVGARPGLDAGVFPTLAALLRLPEAEFREREDALAARAHGEEDAKTREALRLAVRLLGELRRTFGG